MTSLYKIKTKCVQDSATACGKAAFRSGPREVNNYKKTSFLSTVNTPRVRLPQPVDIPFSDLGEDQIAGSYKNTCASKYYKKNESKKQQLHGQSDNLNSQYDDLVKSIRELRLKRKDPKQLIFQLDRLKKQKKKYRQIAQMMSSGEYIEKYGVPLLDLLHSIIEGFKITREMVGDPLLNFLVDLSTTLYNIYKTPEWASVMINMTSFFVRHFPAKQAEMALCYFKAAFEVATAQSTDEFDWSKYILSFFDATSDFLSDELWTKISNFWSKICILYAASTTFVSMETIDIDTALQKFGEFKKMLPQTKDIIEMAFYAFQFVTGNWKHICTGNWKEIRLGKDESKVFELEVRELEQAFSLVVSNQEIELMNIYKLTTTKYMERLDKALKEAKSMVNRASSVQQRMSISNFVKTLSAKQAEIWARQADAPTKQEAYSVKLSGPSSCGKSTMVNMMSKTILNAYGHDPKQRGLVVFTNIEENYESTIKPSHKIIVADDVANNKNKNPNYDRILNYVNTVPRPLEKAEASEKGVYYPGNDAFIATTNDETIRAVKCSVCPESILRRFTIDIGVEIKEEFRNSYGGLIKQDTLRFDVYKLTLKRFSHIDVDGDPEEDRQPGSVVWDIIPRVEWNQYGDENHDFHAMCAYVAKDVQKHRKSQTSQATLQKSLDECDFCGVCRCPDLICACPPEDSEEELTTLQEACSVPLPEIPDFQMDFGTYWSGMSTSELWDVRASLTSLEHFAKKVIVSAKVLRDWKVYATGVSCIVILSLLSVIIGAKATSFYSVAALSFMGYKLKRTIDEVDEEISRRSDRLSSLCLETKEHLLLHAKRYFAVAGAISTMYALYKVFKPLVSTQNKSTYFEEYRQVFKQVLAAPQGHNFEMQDARDYKEGYSRLTPKETNISRTTSSEVLQQSVAKALRVVIVKSRGQVYGTVNGIMVASNVIMVPAHVVPYTFPFDIETTTTPGVPSASTKDQKLTEEYCVIDRDHDHAFIHLASSPASTDFSRFFPEEYPTFYGRPTTFLWKSPDNEVKVSRQVAKPLYEDIPYGGLLEHPGWLWGEQKKLTIVTLSKGKGLQVETEFNGFGGMCGGLYLDSTKGIIYGFHVAGYGGSNTGFATCVLQSQITNALQQLHETSPTLVVHSSTEVKVDTYGLPYSLVNAKPLYTRDDGTQDKTTVTFLGKVLKDGQPLENRARTPYMPTSFSGIPKEFGERKHKPPTRPNDVAKGMKTLNKLTNPVQHYEGDLLKKAIDDYSNQTLKAIRENREEATEMLRLYTQDEAMDGIGKFGLGGLPNDTSAGFPIQKSKKACLEKDPMDESLPKIPREFNDRYPIQDEIDRTEECWRTGFRSEACYKASSKVNELLPNEKATEKVRKFYGSPIANFVASRKALAGIPRFMKRFWRFSECLVGVNPLSKEWSELYEYLTEFSITNMIAGDFAGFDTRMAAQITGAAAKIMISWYKEVGCSEEDLIMIRGALSDIIHPNIIFDGDLYRFANGNPSGNLITVQLNSICNSLMMRYVYYAMVPDIKESFSENVRIGTYGDDNAMSVKGRCKWYTHTSCQQQFAALDISYTMADKGAKSRPYIGIEEISFLKRGFIYHEGLQKIVGPIEEDSSLKRFHWLKKPNETPLTPEEQFGAYTDGALRDYYLRGQVSYDAFVQSLRNIVSENPSLKGFVDFIPYAEMTKILLPDYSDEYVNGNEKLYIESMGLMSTDQQ